MKQLLLTLAFVAGSAGVSHAEPPQRPGLPPAIGIFLWSLSDGDDHTTQATYTRPTFAQFWSWRTDAALRDRDVTWYDGRIAETVAEINAKPEAERTEADRLFLQQKAEHAEKLNVKITEQIKVETARRAARRVDARERRYAACRVEAYAAHAADVWDYTIACMRVAGFKVANPNLTNTDVVFEEVEP